MKDPKFFVFWFILFTVTLTTRAQDAVPNCVDIKVEVRSTATADGRNNGNIDLILEKPFDNYRIFLLSAGGNTDEKVELKSSRLTGLGAGFFDFLIIDKNKKGCIRQLTVILK